MQLHTPMFDYEKARKQGQLRALGHCSLCGINKADTAVGNRNTCTPCKEKWGTTPAPAMATVIALEHEAIANYEAKFGALS